jgi:RNA polymerase sigma-70 factor, ECF subfamily
MNLRSHAKDQADKDECRASGIAPAIAQSDGDVTRMLRQLRSGDQNAAGKLISAVYGELRQLAARAMRRERPGHTLQPTALVNEAFLRLAGAARVEWRDRAHFFGVAAHVMREILVDYARQRSAAKRDSGIRITLDDSLLAAEDRLSDAVAIDEVIEHLSKLDARQGQIVELRFFGGLNVEEIAEVLGISTPTVKREWQSAKAWLHRELTRRSAP